MKTHKECRTCKEDKALSDYHRTKKTKDGRVAHCKDCTSIANKKRYNPEYGRQQHIKNREKRNATSRAYQKENKEELREKDKVYYAKNAENIKRKAREFFHAHYMVDMEWTENYKRKALIRSHNRHSRLRGAHGEITLGQWERLVAKHNFRCVCCGFVRPLERDHVIPVSKGGSNDISNIQPLCRSCNASKRDKIMDYR